MFGTSAFTHTNGERRNGMRYLQHTNNDKGLLMRLRQERMVAVHHAAMFIVAVAHFGMVLLSFANRLNFTVPSKYPFVQLLANNGAWSLIHLGCALFVLAAIIWPKLYRQAMASSTGFMAVWATFNLYWGLSTVSPKGVSLVGPFLAFIVSAATFMMAVYEPPWIRRATNVSH